MRMEQKQTRKPDGRRLIYYHFPETATIEETAVFVAIESMDLLIGAATADSDRSVSGTAQTATVYTPPSDALKGSADV